MVEIMSATWQTETSCRTCGVRVLVRLDPREAVAAGLAVFYCPACGERRQVEHPAGYDPLSVTVTQAPD